MAERMRQIIVRVPPDLHKAVQKAADSEGRYLSSYVRQLLVREVGRKR